MLLFFECFPPGDDWIQGFRMEKASPSRMHPVLEYIVGVAALITSAAEPNLPAVVSVRKHKRQDCSLP